jgi:hypothetical protein
MMKRSRALCQQETVWQELYLYCVKKERLWYSQETLCAKPDLLCELQEMHCAKAELLWQKPDRHCKELECHCAKPERHCRPCKAIHFYTRAFLVTTNVKNQPHTAQTPLAFKGIRA